MTNESLNGLGMHSDNNQQQSGGQQQSDNQQSVIQQQNGNQQPNWQPYRTSGWQTDDASRATSETSRQAADAGGRFAAGQSETGASAWQPAASAQQSASSAHAKEGAGAKTFLLGFSGAAVACVIALAVAFGFGAFSNGGTTLGATTSTTITAEDASATLANQVADKALPSVAAIDVYTQQGGWYSMFGGGSSSSELVESSLGSGVVLTTDGYIITNNHVVEGGEAYRVTVDGQTYDAELVGTDPSSDLAVLKCQDASGLTPIEIGDSDAIQIGDWVMTIGSPFGLEQSVATGIVSATNRSEIMDSSTDGSTTVYTNLIQTDAAINPGNSGGALVDDNGRLIGINTLITSYSGNYSGVGFAIPSNYAVNVAQQIIDGKTPTHAQLGVRMVSVTSQNAEMYGLSTNSGAYVSSVDSGSGAEAAGIQQGDIITAIDGDAIESSSDLQIAVRSHNPGDTVVVTVNRDGETLDLEVTLGEDSSQEEATTQQQSNPGGGSGSGGLSWEDLLDSYLNGGGQSGRSQGNGA